MRPPDQEEIRLCLQQHPLLTCPSWRKTWIRLPERKGRLAEGDRLFQTIGRKARKRHRLVDRVFYAEQRSNICHEGRARWRICTWPVHEFCEEAWPLYRVQSNEECRVSRWSGKSPVRCPSPTYPIWLILKKLDLPHSVMACESLNLWKKRAFR